MWEAPTLRSHPVVWVEPSYGTILRTLRNPTYAGVYVFGRTQTVRELDSDHSTRLRIRKVERKEWPVLIKNHHPAYITFERYLKIQKQLRGNVGMSGERKSHTSGPAREGAALLQGLVRCGRCGRKMYVNYGGHRSKKKIMQYRCSEARKLTGLGKDCQLMGGRRIDELVVREFLRVTEPACLEAAQKANELERERSGEVEKYWKLFSAWQK